MSDEPSEPAPQPEIIIEPSSLGGVYANYATVSHSQHEFTLDFIRLDFASMASAPPGRGIVVARVSVSPLFITQLIDALDQNWKNYAEKALPQEVRGDDAKPDEPGAPEDPAA